MAVFPAGALIDGSSSIAVNATRQQVFSENGGRQYLFIQNVSAGDLWVNFGANAVADIPSMKIPSGASLIFEGAIPTARVDIIGALAGQKFCAKQA